MQVRSLTAALAVVLAALAGPAPAQTSAPAPADTLRIEQALKALRVHVTQEPAVAIGQTRRLLAEAAALGYWRGTLLGYQVLRAGYGVLGRHDSAVIYIGRRLRVARAHRQLETEAQALGDLANARAQQGRFREALVAGQAAEQLVLANPQRVSPNAYAKALNSIAHVYYVQNRYAEAIATWQRAIRAVGEDAAGFQAPLLNNIATVYADNNQLDSAACYARRAAPLARQAGRRDVEALADLLLGQAAFRRGRLAEAEGWLGQARALAAAGQLSSPLCRALTSLAEVYLASNRPGLALAALAGAQRQAAATDDLSLILEMAKVRADVLERLGRYPQALAAVRQQARLTDSLAKLNQTQALDVAETRLADAQRQARLTVLVRENRLVAERNAAQRRLLLGSAAALAALLAGLLGLLWLVGQLRRSRTDLAAARASQDRLYAIVAHDLRGPVTALAGVAGQLEHYVARQDLASLQRLPPLVHRAVAGVNGLLDNLLSWAAAQTGELRARPEALPAAELLAEVAALYAPVAAGKGIALVVEAEGAGTGAGTGEGAAPAGPLLVWADRNMTRTILRNAVGNAVKFTPAGGTVALAARPAPGGRTVLAVLDTGPGLPPAELAAWASGAGELVRRAGSRNEPGTGLGLRLAQTFAQRQGGAVRLAARPEEGTAFELELPARPA